MITRQDPEIKHEVSVFAAFKKHLTIYVIVMIVLWAGWIASGNTVNMCSWPIYPSLAWGLILIIHLLIAYGEFRKKNRETSM